MQFTLSSGTLNARLQTLARVINSKNSISILDCFLFEVANNMLTVTASDNENVMQSTIELDECNGEGRFAISNRIILNAVKELPEQPLSFNVNEDDLSLEVDYQNGSFNFTDQSAEDYPVAAEMENDLTSISIDSILLADNISRSLFATAQDEIRPVMGGIYFLTADSLTIVATDGHKLVRNRILSIAAEENPASFILPQKPAQLLKGVLAKNSGDVVIKFDARSAEIRYADGMLRCRLIEGRYPNYNSVIPNNNTNCLTIDRKSLMGALKRVLPFASESSQLVRFHIEKGLLRLTAEDIDFATSAKESISCDYAGATMDIGFKGSAIYEILNSLTSDEVTIQLADPSRAGVIVPSTQPRAGHPDAYYANVAERLIQLSYKKLHALDDNQHY